MVRQDEPSPAWSSPADAEVLNEARQAAEDALEWQLSPDHWRAIEPVLAALDAAVKAGDVVALADATADLELAGPLRIRTLGTQPVVPPPPPVLYLLNHLVHSLGGTTAGQSANPGDSGAIDDNTASR
jgi:hypothetical protein